MQSTLREDPTVREDRALTDPLFQFGGTKLGTGGLAVVAGDWNIAPDERDIKNWKGNRKNAGFLLEERLHQGGMASLWRVTHPDHRLPMLMKVPRIKGGEDPATIVGFEVETIQGLAPLSAPSARS